MKDDQRVKALRRRVNAEREAASGARVRFSEKLRADVSALLRGGDWGGTRLGEALGLSPSLVDRWSKGAKRASGRLRRVTVTAAVEAEAELSLEFPSGARVRGLTMTQLAQLLEVRS